MPEVLTERKYRISEKILLRAAYSREKAAEIRKEICTACNIHSNTLSRWETITTDQKEMIFGDQLRTVSIILQCEINDLFA